MLQNLIFLSFTFKVRLKDVKQPSLPLAEAAGEHVRLHLLEANDVQIMLDVFLLE